MKKILRSICSVLSIFILFLGVLAIEEGFAGDSALIGSGLLMFLPIGLVLRYFSFEEGTTRKKIIKALDGMLVIFIIKGIISVIGVLSAILALGLPFYVVFGNISVWLIVLGGVGLLLLNKVPLEKAKS